MKFSLGSTGKKIDYLRGILPDIGEHRDTVEVMPDRKSARAGVSYSIQVGAPLLSRSALVDMARLHGGGVMKWWEGGTCRVNCIPWGRNTGKQKPPISSRGRNSLYSAVFLHD